MNHLFGSSPKTILQDKTLPGGFGEISYDTARLKEYIEHVLQLEAVACKDW